MQALRFSSIVCVAGWLAIYFSEVGMMLLLKYFYNITYQEIQSPQNIELLVLYLILIKGSCGFGHRENGKRIWNGSLFIRGENTIQVVYILFPRLIAVSTHDTNKV